MIRNLGEHAKDESGEWFGAASLVNADAEKAVGSEGDRLTHIRGQRDSAALVEPSVPTPVLSPWAA
jgi:hypothetical protein